MTQEASVTPVSWVEKDISAEDIAIDLGILDDHPVARIMRGGNAAADVMVFCTLSEKSDGASIPQEYPTVYKEFDGEASALYVAEEISISSADSSVVHFRVVLPGNKEAWTGEMSLPAK